MEDFRKKLGFIVILLIVVILAVFTGANSFGQEKVVQNVGLGEKTATFDIVKASYDTYDKETKTWSNNNWVPATKGSSITFYDKAIVLIAGGGASIFYKDGQNIIVNDSTNHWWVCEAADSYSKITLTKINNGAPEIIINSLNGEVLYFILNNGKAINNKQ